MSTNPHDTTLELARRLGAQALVCDDEDPGALRPTLEGLNLKFAVSIDSPADGFVPYVELAAGSADEPLFAASNPPVWKISDLAPAVPTVNTPS